MSRPYLERVLPKTLHGCDIIPPMNSLSRIIEVILEGPLSEYAFGGPLSFEDKNTSDLEFLNRAFLFSLCSNENPSTQRALQVLERETNLKNGLLQFYRTAREFILREVKENAEELKKAERLNPSGSVEETQRMVHEILFPEANLRFDKDYTEKLREKRLVRIVKTNPTPIKDPCREVLFTSNALLTVPESLTEQYRTRLGPSLSEWVEKTITEEQIYWYDHPVEIGCPDEENEVLYGLKGLSEALLFERTLKRLPTSSGLSVALSASVTHKGLQCFVRQYLRHLLADKRLPGLEVFVLTEEDTSKLIDEVIGPAFYDLTGKDITAQMRQVFGVDGEYGRHYSFLKAIAAVWKVAINPHIKATFKIDLDQVFPQESLLNETGLTALQHLCTPLWGAEGIDSEGEYVKLGLLAGALVNQKDIERGLFTPDVVLPEGPPQADEVIFHSQVPQALSTIAEMLSRYIPETPIDGHNTCIQRVHVTGGTTGVLVDDLFRYRPFTPTFIGRAEDQAYLMSVLYEPGPPYLRYLHRAGLFMRHDKETFAQKAIKRAEAGKKIGDYLRIMFFSLYAKALPWSEEKTKSALEPFTGSFIHKMPFTMACLRLALRAEYLFQKGQKEMAEAFLKMGSRRLLNVMKLYEENPSFVKDRFQIEKDTWAAYYLSLQHLTDGIKNARPDAIKLRDRARELINQCRV